MCHKDIIKRLPALCEDDPAEKQDHEDEEGNPSSGAMLCVAGEFRAALDTLFKMLSDSQPWFVFCMNPNDSQLPNQFEGRSVKGWIQTLGLGLTEILKRNINVFEAGLTLDEFCTWYKEPLAKMGIVDGSAKEKAPAADEERLGFTGE